MRNRIRPLRRSRIRAVRMAVGTAVAALALTACGEQAQELLTIGGADGDGAEEEVSDPASAEEADTDADPGTDAAEEGEVGDDAATDGDGEAAAEGEGDGAAGDDPSADAGDGAAPVSCDLAATGGTTPLDPDAYEQLLLATNFDLELLVMDLDADLDELLSGGSDGPTLEAQLTDHLAAYEALTAEVADVLPPPGAEAWHTRALESFDGVCTAIGDGLAGSAEGDEERFADYVAALTEFPSLLNELHANAACGPFETC